MDALKRAILEFVETYHENPRPLVWTKTADEILRNRQNPASVG